MLAHVSELKKSRRAAVTLGEVLVEFGGIQGVVPDNSFNDSPTSFYLFVEVSETAHPSVITR